MMLNNLVTNPKPFRNLPWGETDVEQNTGQYDNPYKFNGKELDEESGLYYYGARYYNPRLGIWYGVDPLAEKMPSWSPYAYAFDNPVNAIDPDGREPLWIVGTDGKPVTYKRNKDGSLTWSKNAGRDTKRIGNALARTSEGLAKLRDAINAKHAINFSIDTNKTDSKEFGSTMPSYKLNVKTGEYELSRMDITIYEGTLKAKGKEINETKEMQQWDTQALEYSKLYDKGDIEGMISADTAHEISHATDPTNIIDARYNIDYKGKKGFKRRDIESVPEASENRVLKELNK